MVMQQLLVVFREVFQDEGLTIEAGTTAVDIDDWDSVMHVTLILSVEEHFGVRFSSSEVASLQSVGELNDLIAKKSAQS